MTVIWDGRRDGPGGALLFAPEHETVAIAAPPVRRCITPYGSVTERALMTREQFGVTWFEPYQLALTASITLPQAHTCLANLCERGLARRMKSSRGTKNRPRYQWVPR